MQYRRLGSSGLQVSALSFGSWVTFSFQLDDGPARELMARAYDAGVNFFDNAEAYASGEAEAMMGRCLRELAWSRDSYCVSSKVFWGGQKPTQRGLSRKHVFDACDNALRRLQVDYLDLYFCHRPDANTPIEETVRAMGDLVAQGKVLYWGTSEWSAGEIAQAAGIARALGCAPPTMEQPEYNMFERAKVEREFARLYEDPGLGTTIWSPLASGVLTGKYRDGIPDDTRMKIDNYAFLRERLESEEGQAKIAKARELEPIATELGCSLAQLALAWCLLNPRVSTVILGASKLAQLDENLAALDFVDKLDAEVQERIEAVLGNKPDPAPQF